MKITPSARTIGEPTLPGALDGSQGENRQRADERLGSSSFFQVEAPHVVNENSLAAELITGLVMSLSGYAEHGGDPPVVDDDVVDLPLQLGEQVGTFNQLVIPGEQQLEAVHYLRLVH